MTIETKIPTKKENTLINVLKNKELNTIFCFSFIALFTYIYLVSILYRDVSNPYDASIAIRKNESKIIGNLSNKEDYKSSILTLFFLLILSLIFKTIAVKLFIPPYIGSMIIGMIIQNKVYLKNVFFILPYYLEVTRLSAVIFVLLRTSLTINFDELKKYWKKAFFVGIPPTILGCISITLLTYFLLKVPIKLSLAYAFVIGTTGPAVPFFMSEYLTNKNLGIKNGIGQIWRLATSMDNIFCIISLNVIIDFLFSSKNFNFLYSSLHIILGIGIGFLFSIIYWYYPLNNNLYLYSTTRTLMILTSTGGVLFYFRGIEYYLTPAFAILISSFFAGIRYKKDSIMGIKPKEQIYIDHLWVNIFEPYLFVVTGYQCNFERYNWNNFLISLLIVIFAILTKILFQIISMWFLKLKKNEKMFLSLSLIPRSSIQAANAIMIMNLTHDSDISNEGKIFYLTVVISLLIPTIISQWFYKFLGEKLLKRFTIDDLNIQNVVVSEDKNSI